MGRKLMALAATLALALALVPVLPQAAPAAGTGELTIAESAAARGATYRAWRVFSCDVSDNADGKVARDVSWADDGVEAAVEGAIGAADPAYAGRTAQDAAEWMAANLADAPTATAVASALVTFSPDKEGIEPGGAIELGSGYWLIATEPASVGEGMAGTAPVFALVGGSPVAVEPKAAAPTLVKEVREDSDGSWGPVADATVGDSLPWRIRIEVPSGLVSYTSYPLEVEDEAGAGIDTAAAERTLKVWAASGLAASWDVAEQGSDGWSELEGVEASPEAGRIVIRVPDLVKALGREGFNSGARVLLSYDAPLTGKTQAGANGAEANGALLSYPASPMGEGLASAPRSVARALTWDPVVLKRSSNDGSPLSGAVLRITDDRGRCWNGSKWADGDVTVTTDVSGEARFSGCDSGRYWVEEVSAPDGYRKVAGRHAVGIEATLPSGVWSASSVSARVSADAPLETVSADAASGELVVALDDDPESAPLRTGDFLHFGPALLALIAAMLVVAFVARRHRKRKDGGAA